MHTKNLENYSRWEHRMYPTTAMEQLAAHAALALDKGRIAINTCLNSLIGVLRLLSPELTAKRPDGSLLRVIPLWDTSVAQVEVIDRRKQRGGRR